MRTKAGLSAAVLACISAWANAADNVHYQVQMTDRDFVRQGENSSIKAVKRDFMPGEEVNAFISINGFDEDNFPRKLEAKWYRCGKAIHSQRKNLENIDSHYQSGRSHHVWFWIGAIEQIAGNGHVDILADGIKVGEGKYQIRNKAGKKIECDDPSSPIVAEEPPVQAAATTAAPVIPAAVAAPAIAPVIPAAPIAAPAVPIAETMVLKSTAPAVPFVIPMAVSAAPEINVPAVVEIPEPETKLPATAERHTHIMTGGALFHFNGRSVQQMYRNGVWEIGYLAENVRKTYKEIDSVEVAGYTDYLGSKAYNQRLSQDRAETVKQLLIQNGIPDSLIRAVGHGEEEQIKTCPRDLPRLALHECLAPNRRVEVTIQGETR